MYIGHTFFLIKLGFFMVYFLSGGDFAYSLTFNEVRIPPSKSILIHPHQFFVFKKDDLPHGSFASEHFKYPVIHFKELKVKSMDGIIQNSDGIEVIILPSNDLEYLIKNDQLGMCCNKENLLSGDCQIENTFIKPKVDGLIYLHANLNNSNYSSIIKKGGAYSLMISNCGNLNDGYILGELVIESAYGFLPAIEFMKIKLYLFGAGLYSFLTIYWAYKCIRNSEQLINMQYYMLGELVLSILSSYLWLHYFKQWNITGSNSTYLLVISTITNILKLTILVIMTLIASHGVGIYKTSIISRKRSIVILMTGIMYFLNTLFKEYVALLKSRNINVTPSLLLYSVLPIGILNGVVSFWVFHELVNLLYKLDDDKQKGRLSLYKRFTYILFFAAIVAFAFFILEIRFYSWDIAYRWKYQWIIQDAIPFFFVSILELNLLLLWTPKENSKKYLDAAEVPMEVIIELETQGFKNIALDNKKDLEYTSSQNKRGAKYIDIDKDDQHTITDSDNTNRIFKQLDRQNDQKNTSDETNYREETLDYCRKYIENKHEVNKENSVKLINTLTKSNKIIKMDIEH